MPILINILSLLLSVILVHQSKQDIICVMLNFNFTIDGQILCLDFHHSHPRFCFRFRCDDHCVCEVSAEEVFKSEWSVDEYY